MRTPNLENPPMVNPEAATSGLKESRFMTGSLTKMYDTIANVGEQVSKIGEKFYHVYQTAELNRAETANTKAMMEKLVEFETRTDYQNFDQEWRDFTNKNKEEAVKNSKLMGPYLDKFSERYDQTAIANYPKVLSRSRELAMDDYKSSLLGKIEQSERLIISAASPEEGKRIRQNISEDIAVGTNKGMIKKTDAFTLEQKLNERLDDAGAKKILMDVSNGKMDPIVAAATLENPNSLMNLDPIRRIEYQKQLEVVVHRRKGELKEARIDSAYTTIREKFPNDPDGAIKFLEDPEKFKGIGIASLDEASHLRNVFVSQKAFKDHETDQAKKKTSYETVNKFYELVNNGQGGNALRYLKKAADAGVVDQDDYFKARKMLEKAPGEVKTDPITYIALEERILRGVASPNEIMLSNNLSKSDKAGLLSKAFTKQDQAMRDAEHEAKAYVKSQIITTGMLGNPNPAEYERVHKANVAIDFYSDQAKKSGKPWTAKEYNDYAEQLVRTFKTTPESKIRDMRNMITVPGKAGPTVPGKTSLSSTDESKFKDWYVGWAKKSGIDTNPDDPNHKYDYRAAYKAGVGPSISKEDNRYHWPSQFKDADHPRRFINGIDTRTGKQATGRLPGESIDAYEKRMGR